MIAKGGTGGSAGRIQDISRKGLGCTAQKTIWVRQSEVLPSDMNAE